MAPRRGYRFEGSMEFEDLISGAEHEAIVRSRLRHRQQVREANMVKGGMAPVKGEHWLTRRHREKSARIQLLRDKGVWDGKARPIRNAEGEEEFVPVGNKKRIQEKVDGDPPGQE